MNRRKNQMKGISPLVAVIMLIAFTLVIAGIVAGWATQFAQQQRSLIQTCSGAGFIINGGTWTENAPGSTQGTLRLVIVNIGKTDLKLFALLSYENLTLHESEVERYNGTFEIKAGDVKNFVLNDISNDLREATLQSDECVGAQNVLQKHYIRGLF